MNRLKLAELISGAGALVLGVGLGALFPGWFGPFAGVIAFVGVCLHSFGMWARHLFEAAADNESPPWTRALYWACWLLLAGVLAILIIPHAS